MNDVAVAVAEDLDLDWPGIFDELLDEHAVVAEARARLAAGGAQAVTHLLIVARDAHALAAAAGRGLDHHGIADGARDLHSLAVVLNDAEMAGNDIHL